MIKADYAMKRYDLHKKRIRILRRIWATITCIILAIALAEGLVFFADEVLPYYVGF